MAPAGSNLTLEIIINQLKFQIMKKIMLTMAFTSMVIAACLAQSTGEIRGRVIDEISKETLPLANIYVIEEPNLIGTTADVNGNFVLKPLSSGKHTIVISYTGYSPDTIVGVYVTPNSITKLNDISLVAGIWLKGDYGKTDYVIELIRVDPVPTIRADEIADIAGKTNLSKILETMSSNIYVNDDKEIYFKGARKDNFVYIVDGVKCADGEAHVASGAIGSMMVYTGGVPAQYGDFTGGCIVIETKNFFTN
jgi:hypothetical protein